MGKSSNRVEPTEAEIAQAEIHREQWNRYEEYGIPLENEYIRRTTGYRFDDETGDYVIDDSAGVLNQDGTVRTDTTTANTANERAYGRVISRANPNRLTAVEELNREGAAQGSASSTSMALGQQRNARIGLLNAVARGKGQEGEAMQRQSEQSQLAQQEAMSAARESATRGQTASYLVGTVGGLAGIGFANSQGRLDSFDPTVTPRKPGDHHPS